MSDLVMRVLRAMSDNLNNRDETPLKRGKPEGKKKT